MLDVKRMRVLREIARQGSFSAAADELYLSQSAVSQHLAALEKEVGQKLVQRASGGVHLTQAGEVLVSHADAVLCRLDEAERELAALAGMRGGRLRLVSFPSASATLVTAAAAEFTSRHPEVKLELREAEPEDSFPALKRGEADVALLFDYELVEAEADRDVEYHLLLEDRMWAALPKGHPLAKKPAIELSELAEEPWLRGQCDSTCRQMVTLACRDAGFEPQVSYESDDYAVLQGLVAAKLGVTLLPDLALTALHPGVEVVAVKPKPPLRRVWAATLAEGSRSPAAEAMVEILVETSRNFAEQVARPIAVAA
jgi:molybdate transport repressor ModE-like protein